MDFREANQAGATTSHLPSSPTAAEAFQCLWISGNIIWQELERDEPAQICVFGLVDHTHPATAELLYNTVMRDGLADQLGGGGHDRES